MLNWLTRYAPALTALETRGPLGSILDVGCGSHGLACARPDLPFVGVDVSFPDPPTPSMVAFEVEPGPLPFEDAAFDTVLSLDALEHLPGEARRPFVLELTRVAAGAVLLACPSAAAEDLDDQLRRHLAAAGVEEPGWLEEHRRFGLPTAEEVEGCVRDLPAFSARRVPMANGLLCRLVVMADVLGLFGDQAAAEMGANDQAWSRLFAQARFGDSFRTAWLLERTTPRRASVQVGNLAATAQAALRAPESARLVGDSTLPPPDTEAAIKLWLEPDWHRYDVWIPALAVYLRHAPANGSTCLCVCSPEGGEPATTLLGAAYEALAPAEAPDVLLVEGSADRTGTVTVRSAQEVTAALAAPEEAIDAHVARATAAVAAAAYSSAPAPDTDPGAGVSVVIGADEAAVASIVRAVESALGSTHQALEVLVRGAGADLEHRLRRLADPRVRIVQGDPIEHAQGDWVLHLPPDGSLLHDHVGQLLQTARLTKADTIGAQVLRERPGLPPRVERDPVAMVSTRVARSGGPRTETRAAMLDRVGIWRAPHS